MNIGDNTLNRDFFRWLATAEPQKKGFGPLTVAVVWAGPPAEPPSVSDEKSTCERLQEARARLDEAGHPLAGSVWPKGGGWNNTFEFAVKTDITPS